MANRIFGICAIVLLSLSGCASTGERVLDGDAIVAGAVNAPVFEGFPQAIGPQTQGVQVAARSSYGPGDAPLPGLKGPHAVDDAEGPYLLDTGDKLRIFVYGQPNLSRSYTVDHQGQITVPLIGEVKARGLTTVALEHAIKARLGTQYVRDPQVTVDMLQNRPFFILGEVKLAGQYPYVSGMTVETAVAIAGGYSERASMTKFRVTRRINGLVDVIEAPADYVLQPGDTVTVFERFF